MQAGANIACLLERIADLLERIGSALGQPPGKPDWDASAC